MHSHPDQIYRRGGFGGISQIIARIKTDTAVIGDKAGMAFRHRGFDGLEVRLYQRLAVWIVLLQFKHAAAQGAADLLHVGRQQRLRNADLRIKLLNKLQRIQG